MQDSEKYRFLFERLSFGRCVALHLVLFLLFIFMIIGASQAPHYFVYDYGENFLCPATE